MSNSSYFDKSTSAKRSSPDKKSSNDSEKPSSVKKRKTKQATLFGGKLKASPSKSSNSSYLSPTVNLTEVKNALARKDIKFKTLADSLPADWAKLLEGETNKPYFRTLLNFLAADEKTKKIFPPKPLIFAAFHYTPFAAVRVVIVGQDPYHDNGQAEGLCFSVPQGIAIPSSLRNMYKEIGDEYPGTFRKPKHGHLGKWTAQGVFLLNTSLTVRAHAANSHKGKGWEKFTSAVLRLISQQSEGVVFLLWGKHAQNTAEKVVDASKHHILKSPHPSGLSAHRGFYGNGHFKKCNDILVSKGQPAIDWQV